MFSRSPLLEELCNLVHDRVLGLGADDFVDRLTALEKDHCGDAHYFVLNGSALRLVNVDLGDLQIADLFVGDLIHDRGDHLAGATPFSPEID